MPGTLNRGQNQRGYQTPSLLGRRARARSGGSATGLELGPDVVPGRVYGRAQFEFARAGLPDRFVDDRLLQGRGNQLLLDEEIRGHGGLWRLVAHPTEVLHGVVEVQHEVEEEV